MTKREFLAHYMIRRALERTPVSVDLEHAERAWEGVVKSSPEGADKQAKEQA